MSLYDMMEEISEKQVTKTETGDTRISGVVVGVVAKNYDKDMPGRVCVTIPTRDDRANELQWARKAFPSGGKKGGHYFVPEVGDQVLLAFEGGNIEKPYIIGSVLEDNAPLLRERTDENNQFKCIETRNGSTILFEDNKEGDGEKDKITMETAGKTHQILMDNENKLIRVSDKKKENMVELSTESGQMVLRAKSKLTIEVGDNIKLILNGDSGAIQITANEFSVKTSKGMQLKTDGMLKQEGAQVSHTASSLYKAESSGMMSFSGSPMKLGK